MICNSDTQQILSDDENQETYDRLQEEYGDICFALVEMTSDLPKESDSSATDNIRLRLQSSDSLGLCSSADPGSSAGPSNSAGQDARAIDEENITCKLSSSSVCCRICQNGESSEQLLEESPCHCKGSLGKAHKSCLLQWVRYKGSNRCEICGGIFDNINPPSRLGVNQLEPEVEPPTDNFYFEALEALRWHLARWRPLSRQKRSAMAAVITFLLLMTLVTAILTVGADRDFVRANQNPWVSRSEQEKAHMVFSVCLSFLFFSGTLCIGLAAIWLVLECYYATQRRQILQRTAERMVAEGLRERRASERRARDRQLAERLQLRLGVENADVSVSNETVNSEDEV